MFVSQLANEDLCQFSHIENKVNVLQIMAVFKNTQEKKSYGKSHLKVVFMISVMKKTAYSLL